MTACFFPAIAMNAAPSRFLPILLAVSLFMQLLDATVLNTALPQMAVDLHESPLHMHSTIIAYALTLALFMPLSGYLCDRYGTKKVFSVSMWLFVLGSLLCAAAPSLTMLVIARVIQGMGGAILVPMPRLIVLRSYPKSQILAVMNFIIMPALLGPIMGPLVGGYLVEYASWQWIFLLNVPIGILGILMTARIMPNYYAPDARTPHFDLAGFLLFAGGAVGLSLAVEMLMYAEARLFAVACALLGVTLFTFYWLHARHDEAKALYSPQLRLVRTFRLGLLGNLLSRLGMAAVPFLLPLLLQLAFARSASIAGWTMAPIAFAALVAKPFIKPFLSRVGYRRVLIWNTRLIGLIIMSLALPTAETPWWQLIALLFVLGLCNSLQYSTMNTLTIADLRPMQTGSGSSLLAVNQQLAISFGIALGALLLNLFSHDLPPHELHHAFRATFLVIGSITFLSSWVFTRLHRLDGENLIK